MKSGTTASIMTFVLLHRIRDRLKGRLTLTCVSDEESFGPWGARYLMEHHPEVLGDCCLNGEPSIPYSIRFGEKGPLWLRFTVRTAGAHGAYTHASPSATRLAAALIRDLEALEDLPVELPDNLMRAQLEGIEASDRAMGEGASAIVPRSPSTSASSKAASRSTWCPASAASRPTSAYPSGWSAGGSRATGRC